MTKYVENESKNEAKVKLVPANENPGNDSQTSERVEQDVREEVLDFTANQSRAPSGCRCLDGSGQSAKIRASLGGHMRTLRSECHNMEDTIGGITIELAKFESH